MDGLSGQELSDIENTISYFRQAELALGRSPKTGLKMTLGSFRHQFIANAKITLSDPVVIAAAVGHVSTKSAFEQDGARRHGKTKFKVVPTPESVQAV